MERLEEDNFGFYGQWLPYVFEPDPTIRTTQRKQKQAADKIFLDSSEYWGPDKKIVQALEEAFQEIFSKFLKCKAFFKKKI